MDGDCLPVDIAQITQAIEENAEPWRRLQRARVERKEAKVRNVFGLLSVRY
jgi:hypothetical protein